MDAPTTPNNTLVGPKFDDRKNQNLDEIDIIQLDSGNAETSERLIEEPDHM